MANSIKKSMSGLALQITNPARTSGLVEEDADGEATRLAKVRVYSFERLLLVVDKDQVANEEIVEMVTAAARDTRSIHRAMDSTVKRSGHGYQVQLGPAQDAGFEIGDKAPVTVSADASGVLCISRDSKDRLSRDIISIRESQMLG